MSTRTYQPVTVDEVTRLLVDAVGPWTTDAVGSIIRTDEFVDVALDDERDAIRAAVLAELRARITSLTQCSRRAVLELVDEIDNAD
jgi:hypothetical protein